MKIAEWLASKLIALPAPFDFTFGSSSLLLIESIKKIGLLNMPVILESDKDSSGFLVTGKRRVRILHDAYPESKTWVRVFSNDELTNLTAFQINLFENVATRDLNPIEKSNILSILTHRLSVSPRIIKEDYFDLLRLPGKDTTLDDYLEFQKLSEEDKQIIAQGFIQIENAIRLNKFKLQDRIQLLHIIRELRLSSNSQKILIELARELSKRDKISFSKILEKETALNLILNHAEWSPSQKWSKFESALKHLRYPKLSQMEDDFKNIKQQLHLPPSISLQNPPYFETNDFQIHFRFKNKKEFEDILKILNSMGNESNIHSLFKLTLEDES